MLMLYQLSLCRAIGKIVKPLLAIDIYSCLRDSCHLQVTFANRLYQDQAQINRTPGLESNCLTLMVFLKECFEVSIFEKNTQTAKIMKNLPACCS